MGEPGGLPSMGLHRVGHDRATSLSLFTFMHWRRKWQPTPVFLPGEFQVQGSLWAAVSGVTQSQTQLKWLSSSNSSITYVCVCAQSVVSNSAIPWLQPPVSSVHGILQERTLEWVAISSSRASSLPRDQTHVSCVSCTDRQILYHWSPSEEQHHIHPQRTFKTFHVLLTAIGVSLDGSSPSASGQDQCLTAETDHAPENAPGKGHTLHSHFPWGGQMFPREGTETHTGTQLPSTSWFPSHLCHRLGHLCCSWWLPHGSKSFCRRPLISLNLHTQFVLRAAQAHTHRCVAQSSQEGLGWEDCPMRLSVGLWHSF